MSALYPDLDKTLFPENLDQRYIMIDPSNADDMTAINRYNSFIDVGDMRGAISVLADNPRLERMMFNADKWNRHEDMLIAIERFYHADVQTYLVNLVVYRGEWDYSAIYAKYNVVIWNGMAYMATTIVPAGIYPSENDYWVPITLQGQQGVSGTGLSWRGLWDEHAEYFADDCVSHNGTLWAAKSGSIGNTPDETSAVWDKVFKIDVSAGTLLTTLKDVDGEGSGLDADLLDGHESAYFATTETTDALQEAHEQLADTIETLDNAAIKSTEQALNEDQQSQVRQNISAQKAVTYSTTDLTAGVSALATGEVYLVYE